LQQDITKQTELTIGKRLLLVLLEMQLLEFTSNASTNGINFYTYNGGATYGIKMAITSGGNVLIGTTTDNGARLQVSGEGKFYQPLTNTTSYLTVENNRARNAAIRLKTTVGDYYLGTGIGADVNQFQIYDGTSGVNRLVISSTGAATFGSSVTANGISSIGQEQAFTWQRTTGTASDIYSLNADSGSAYLYNNTTANILMMWSEGGNVGIGTASPLSLTNQTRISINATVASGVNLFVNNVNTAFYAASSGGLFVGTVTNIPFNLSTNDIERVQITGSGNVLIGTTTDNGARLRVVGTGHIPTLTHEPSYHGTKVLIYGPTSSTTINLPTEFPLMGLTTGNVWAIFGKYCGLTSGGGSEAREFYISRNTSGTWSSAAYSLDANTGASLSSVSGSGANLVIATTSNAYFSLELTVMIR
jgi:hypothetical protein